MLGINGPPAFADANGILVEKMALEFGWTKTQHSSAMLLQMPLGLLPFALGLLMLGSHLCSWRFDQYLFFGSIYTLVQMALAVTSGLWPLLANCLFDVNRSYLSYYEMAVSMILFATILILFVPTIDKIVPGNALE